MSNLDQFRHHVFLSYGWADIPNEGEGDRGWVKEFKHQLQLQLHGELGRQPRIFLDAENKPNGLEDLDAALRSSALFVTILTPASCREGSWCRWELDLFNQHSAGILPGYAQFRAVLARQVDKKEWLMPQLVPRDFMVRGFPLPASDLGNATTPAGQLVQDFARELKEALLAVDRQIAKTVFLAHTSAAYQSRVARLATETTKRGNIVIRGVLEPGEAQAAFLERTEGQLRRASLSVHILDSATDAVPAGWTDSVESLQLRAASDRFGKVKNRMITSQESLQAESLDEEAMVRAQVLKGTGFEYLETVLRESMQRQMAEAAQRSAPRPEPIPEPIVEPPDSRPGPSEEPLYVFVDCVQDDLGKIELLKPMMRVRNIRIRPPVFEGDEEERRQLRDEFLELCHGVAVYFGSRQELKALIACQSLRKVLRSMGREVPRCVIIDPDSQDRLETVFPDFDNYRASKVDEFSRRVREWRT
jgi:hypothetical protein